MRALLDASFWRGLAQEETFDQQATMLQPVGGMDRIPYAFAQRLGKTIKYGCTVSEIRKTENGVRVVYSERGAIRSLTASYCVLYAPPGGAQVRQARFFRTSDGRDQRGVLHGSLQDCLGVPAVLGAGCQHLRWHFVAGTGTDQS